jgi:hypothetical protein
MSLFFIPTPSFLNTLYHVPRFCHTRALEYFCRAATSMSAKGKKDGRDSPLLPEGGKGAAARKKAPAAALQSRPRRHGAFVLQKKVKNFQKTVDIPRYNVV